MFKLKGKRVLLIGLGSRGRSACRLLCASGASVVAVDCKDNDHLQRETKPLAKLGAEVHLGLAKPLAKLLDDVELGVISVGGIRATAWVSALQKLDISMIGELELGFQQLRCLNIAVTGTNGKTSTAKLIERVLSGTQRETRLAGKVDCPVGDAVDGSKELDYLIVAVNSFQLELTQFFSPTVAVLTNITSDHMDHYGSMAEYVKAKARMFANQQPFDWAIIQSEALAQIRSIGIEIPSKIITFSSSNRRADISLDRGLIVSRVPGWEGPLLDFNECQLQGAHNAEIIMAALAVGRVLRIPLEQSALVLRNHPALPHRCEIVAEIGGVSYINDSRSTNLAALEKSLSSMKPGSGGNSNIWLLAGGRDKAGAYHDIGPLLSNKVKAAFLMGETREKLRAAWSLFTPCRLVDSLEEGVRQAAELAEEGDVILLSPASEDSGTVNGYQHRGEMFRRSVELLAGTSTETESTGKAPPASKTTNLLSR
ncbi:MAG: UDP-N-acetylmuramoyl-L-alanine--D-glutamate ligase [Verrucomicrobia bacterium]|nr:UDP-N-acetylmuramoyl-L-alanine--D-glutamate ligase [Verrucomicrobiota bacterium]